jgi:hypothetical protein
MKQDIIFNLDNQNPRDNIFCKTKSTKTDNKEVLLT